MIMRRIRRYRRRITRKIVEGKNARGRVWRKREFSKRMHLCCLFLLSIFKPNLRSRKMIKLGLTKGRCRSMIRENLGKILMLGLQN